MADYGDSLQTIFSFVFELMTSWTIPIIGLTPAVFLLSMMVFNVIVFIFMRAIGVGSAGIAQGSRDAISDTGRALARRDRSKRRRKNKSK